MIVRPGYRHDGWLGDVVWNLSAVDPDPSNAHTFLFGDQSGQFNAVAIRLTVRDGVRLDFENATSCQMTVRAADLDNLALEKARAFDVIKISESLLATDNV